jgi:HAD superfamily hydrolase (TIGR01509 family)
VAKGKAIPTTESLDACELPHADWPCLDRRSCSTRIGGVPISGVMFDWRGTLIGDPDDSWWVRTALSRVGRNPDESEVVAIVRRLQAASTLRVVAEARGRADCSADLHRNAAFLWFGAADLEPEVAEALYGLDREAIAHPMFEDVPESLERIKALDVGIAIVSDIHFDLRPEFAQLGLDRFVDHFVLSFEHGVQKPDPRIFTLALDLLGVHASEALMVGDRPARDGGAVDVGIPTLLLPPMSGPLRGLDRVVALITSGSAQSN